MRGRRVTMRDIAASIGVSVNTVSRALNAKGDVSPEIRARVRAAAERLGYRPNKLARGLRASKTGTIGVIVTDIANPYFSTLVKEIVNTAWPEDYSIVLQGTDEDYRKERHAVRLVLEEQVEGVLLAPTQLGTEAVEELLASGVPCVLMARYFEDLDVDYVVMDDLQGGLLATGYLLDLGHERVAMINGPMHISSARERYEGYMRAHTERGKKVDQALVVGNALTIDDGYLAARELLRREVPSAIFALSDFVACGVLRALRERGIRVPEDVLVVGFGDIPFAGCLETPLITVGGSRETLGREATMLLIKKLRGELTSGPQHIRLPVQLIVRAAPRRAESRAAGVDGSGAIAYFGPCRSRITVDAGRGFRLKPVADFGRSRSRVSG